MHIQSAQNKIIVKGKVINRKLYLLCKINKRLLIIEIIKQYIDVKSMDNKVLFYKISLYFYENL